MFSKTRQNELFLAFWSTFVHSKCKRSSLRSQCWMRLFRGFSNTVFLRLKRFFIHHKTYSICWTSRHRKRGEMTFKKWPPKKAFCSNNIMTWEVNCLDISSLLSHSLESHIQLAVPSSELLLIKRRSGSRMPCFDFLFDWFSDISFHRILRNGF